MRSEHSTAPAGGGPNGGGGSGERQLSDADGFDSIDSARWIIEKYGWPVFPCHSVVKGRCSCARPNCDSPGKHPRVRHGANAATTDPAQVEQWHSMWPSANWATVPHGAFVIDVDRRQGGFESIDAWRDRLPETLRVLSGGGGRHLYFSTDVPVANRNNWLPGVDVKTEGGYVLLPGSTHISGGTYAWLSQVDMAPAPPDLIESIVQGRVEGSTTGNGFDLSDVLQGVPEGERDVTMFRYACKLRRQFNDDREIVTINALLLNARCDPPMDEAQVRKCVDSAFKQDHDDAAEAARLWDQLTRGVTTQDDELAIAERTRQVRINREAHRRADRLEATSLYPARDGEMDGLLSDLMALPPRFEDQRVDGIIGMTHNSVLAAQFKSGKTTLGCNLMVAAARGDTFLGRKVTLAEDERVGWLNGEMDRDDFLNYIRPMGVGPEEAARIYVRNLRGRSLNLLNEHVREQFITELRDANVSWLWVDSWRLLCSWAGVNENANSEVEQLTQALDQVKTEAGVQTLTVLAHTGRAVKEEGREHARGATALDDWQDSRLVMTRQGDDRFIYAEGRGIHLDEVRLSFDPVTHLVSIGGGDRKSTRADKGVQAVVDVVTANPGVKAGDVRQYLKDMANLTHAADQSRVMTEAEAQGLVHFVSGPRNAKLYHPGPSPELQMARSLQAQHFNTEE